MADSKPTPDKLYELTLRLTEAEMKTLLGHVECMRPAEGKSPRDGVRNMEVCLAVIHKVDDGVAAAVKEGPK